MEKKLSIPTSLLGLRDAPAAAPAVAPAPVTHVMPAGACVVCEGPVVPSQVAIEGGASFHCSICGIAYVQPPGLRCECGEVVDSAAGWEKEQMKFGEAVDDGDDGEAFTVRHVLPPGECAEVEED